MARDLSDFLGGQAADIRADFLIQQGAKVLHADLFGQHARHIFQHRLDIGITLVKLGTGQAVFSMENIGKLAVRSEALGGEQALPKAEPGNRNIAQNHHSTSTRGDLTDFFAIVLLFESHCGGGEDNPVLQANPAILNRTGNGFIHAGFHPLSV